MPVRLAVVCEANADFLLGSTLADRIIEEQATFSGEHQLTDFRDWLPLDPPTPFLKWKSLSRCLEDARKRGFRVPKYMGHFNGESHGPDALPAYRALMLLREHRPTVVFLLRDQDDQPQRSTGLQAAKDRFQLEYPETRVVIGFAVIERESWVLSGFVAQDEDEQHRLNELRRELGFDPTVEPERLNAAKNDQAKKSPKRVLNHLTANDKERDASCWTETQLEELRTRGRGNGLSDYLNACRDVLVPLMTGSSIPH